MTDSVEDKPKLSGRALFPEYVDPVNELFTFAAHELCKIEEPLLANITWGEATVSSGSTPVGKGVATEPFEVKVAVPMKVADMLETSIEAWTVAVFEQASQSAPRFVQRIVEMLGQVTEGTGNVVSGSVSHDLLLDVMERTAFEVDENLQPINMSFLGSSQMLKEMQALPPRTQEQEERYRAIMVSRREAQDAKKRTRRMD